jgi:hypothetical protein
MTNSKLVQATRQYDSLTQNGAVTHSTSLSACLDMFFLAGASRRLSEQEIIQVFIKARAENYRLAYQILFWARNCRGGAGEKRFFRVIAIYCKKYYTDEYNAVAILVPKYGSWKDLFLIDDVNKDSLSYLWTQMNENPNANLIFKYFPRKGPWFVGMHKFLDLTPKAFRKLLASESNTVEQKLCANIVEAINYSHVPSVAMNNYKHLFMMKDSERFNSYISDVQQGKNKINASVLFPHQVLNSMEWGKDGINAAQVQWDALPNYMEGSSERILPVCDVSGSMAGLPMDVCVALGMYISERNESIFKDAFITFSERPTMQYVQGDNLFERFNSLASSEWGMSTNLQATFDLVLDSAVREKIPASQMPTKLLILSDMEFDSIDRSGTSSNLDHIRTKYSDAGYTMPEIIFWNLNGRVGNVPANKADKNIGLVSGFSPSILVSILQGKVETPEELMLQTVEDYKDVVDCLELFA